MWIDSDAARSDFILAAAAYVLVPILVSGVLARLPFYPRQPTAALLLAILWILLAGAVTPVLLARYRDQGATAFGLEGRASAAAGGLLLAVPVFVVSLLRALPVTDVTQALLGRFSIGQRGGPTIPPDLVAIGIVALGVVVLLVSSVLLLTFLSVRAGDGFRGTDMGLTAALRTFGMGAAGLGLVMGLLNTLRGATGWQGAVINTLGLVAVVLIADRIIPAGGRTTRAAILAPTAVVVVGFVFAGGGFFGGDLLGSLYIGSLGGGITVVVAALVAGERAWASVPLLAAIALYPTCLTPLVSPLPEALLMASGC